MHVLFHIERNKYFCLMMQGTDHMDVLIPIEAINSSKWQELMGHTQLS